MSFPFENAVAVITGAAKGMGAEMAKCLAERSCHLALIDRDDAGLATVAQAARAKGVSVSTHALDIADAAAIEALPQAVLANHRRVNILINNAGVALMGLFDEVTLADMEWLININFWGTVRMCKAFAPMLRREPVAQIVNMSSMYGIIAPPGQTAYAASKFAVRGFSEALRHELDGTGVRVMQVHPGGVRTTIAHTMRVAAAVDLQRKAEVDARFAEFAKTMPDAAARQIIEGIETGRKRVLIGADARKADIMARLMPVGYGRILKRRRAKIERQARPLAAHEPQR